MPESNLILNSAIADAIEDIVVETSRGLRAARSRGVLCFLPEAIDIEFTLLVQANAVGNTSTRAEPQTTTTSTEIAPVITTTETKAAVTRTTTATDSANTTTSTQTRGRVTSETLDTGSDISDTAREHRYFDDDNE